MRLKKVVALMGISLILSQSACSDSSPADSPVDDFEYNYDLISGEKDGEYHFRYYVQDDCITYNRNGEYEISLYDPVDLESVCMDPVCMHEEGSACTARGTSYEGRASSFCVTYNDKLIIVDSYEVQSETDDGVTYTWKTDVYEAQLDGSNRRCVVSFNGGTQDSSVLNGMIMVDGKLYLGGLKFASTLVDDVNEGGLPTYKYTATHAVYAIDLNDYSVKEYLQGEGQLSFCLFYECDGVVYVVKRQDPKYELYRIDVNTDKAEKIFESKEVVMLKGVTDDTIYYQYQNRDATILYSRKIGADDENVFKENVFHSIVMDKKIYVMEYDQNIGEQTKYLVYDVEGNLLESFEYDRYLYICGDVGDKVIYYTKEKVGVVEKENLVNVFSVGQEIGNPL